MAEIKLNIYNVEDKQKIDKTYTVNSIDLLFGTVEDILNVVDLDKLNDEKAVAVMVVKAWAQLKPFLKDVFPGLTDEEIKHVKINEMIPVFMEIFASVGENIGLLVSGKN